MAQSIKSSSATSLEAIDPIWSSIRQEAEEAIGNETLLGAFMHSSLLNHQTLEQAVAHRVAERLDHADVPADPVSYTHLRAHET